MEDDRYIFKFEEYIEHFLESSAANYAEDRNPRKAGGFDKNIS